MNFREYLGEDKEPDLAALADIWAKDPETYTRYIDKREAELIILGADGLAKKLGYHLDVDDDTNMSDEEYYSKISDLNLDALNDMKKKHRREYTKIVSSLTTIFNAMNR